MPKYLKNPAIEIDVKSDDEFTIKGGNNGLYVDFEIHKDLSEEPNEAEVTIYNLSQSTRSKLSNSTLQSTPIEIFLTETGKSSDTKETSRDDMVLAFRGEIETVVSRRARPGYETRIVATSQKENHRAFYFGPKTYAKSTPISQIINDLISAVGLHCEKLSTGPSAIPDTPIILAHTLSGAAFPLLRRICEDIGCYAFISDGVLRISNYNAPPVTTATQLHAVNFLETPSLTTRMDEEGIAMTTVVEMTSVNPFARIKKKKNKRAKVVGENDYVEYDACEKEITGVDYVLTCFPDIKPDDLVTVADYTELIGKTTRVREVHHYGSNYGGEWTTELFTDDIEEDLL